MFVFVIVVQCLFMIFSFSLVGGGGIKRCRDAYLNEHHDGDKDLDDADDDLDESYDEEDDNDD